MKKKRKRLGVVLLEMANVGKPMCGTEETIPSAAISISQYKRQCQDGSLF